MLETKEVGKFFSFGRVFNELEVEIANDFKFFAGLRRLGWNQWV